MGWALSTLPPLPALLALLALRGVAGATPGLVALTVSQERIPSHLRGRVFGAGRAVALAAIPLGMIIVGYALEAIDLRGTLVALALAHLVLALVLLPNAALRNLDRAP